MGLSKHLRYRPIDDYALIGDCGTAALISREGSIDWLCLPRFDSPSVFAAILDPDEGGFFRVCPVAPFCTERAYVKGTTILQTTFTTATGTLRLTDHMPVAEDEAHDPDVLWPDHEILRTVECLEGSVEVEVMCDPEADYGRAKAHLRKRGALGYMYASHGEALALRSDIDLEPRGDGRGLAGTATLHEGERRHLAITYDQYEPCILPLLGDEAQRRTERSADYWQGWIERCAYEGPYKEAVQRSALTLKLMTYSHSGAVVAAPTTSLPEALGGMRNWDYRYCWLRDSAFVLRALSGLGYRAEEEAFLSWMMQAVRTTLPKVKVLYDVHGNQPPPEQTLDHLAGYRCTSPVRIGNGASDQFQLDVYGEVISAAYEHAMLDRYLTKYQRRMLEDLGTEITRRWQDPDDGIWEIRGDHHRHTYSVAMCWVGLQRLIELDERGDISVPVDEYRALMDRIREEIETQGYNEDMDCYTASFNGDQLDASLLLMAAYGYIDADAPRMRSTWQRIEEHLEANNLLYRYRMDDGFDSEEGAFGICSFWAAEYLAHCGKLDAAETRFEKVLAYANDVGLFSEEYDPSTGMALGNFPQAFTHVGLINAALSIEDARQHGQAGHDGDDGARTTAAPTDVAADPSHT